MKVVADQEEQTATTTTKSRQNSRLLLISNEGQGHFILLVEIQYSQVGMLYDKQMRVST